MSVNVYNVVTILMRKYTLCYHCMIRGHWWQNVSQHSDDYEPIFVLTAMFISKQNLYLNFK